MCKTEAELNAIRADLATAAGVTEQLVEEKKALETLFDATQDQYIAAITHATEMIRALEAEVARLITERDEAQEGARGWHKRALDAEAELTREKTSRALDHVRRERDALRAQRDAAVETP